MGVGKTLSLAASAMVSALLDDGPLLILCPSTLTLQWQVELKDEYIHLRQKARTVFELGYKETIAPDQNRWELCSRVLARRDIVDRLSVPW